MSENRIYYFDINKEGFKEKYLTAFITGAKRPIHEQGGKQVVVILPAYASKKVASEDHEVKERKLPQSVPSIIDPRLIAMTNASIQLPQRLDKLKKQKKKKNPEDEVKIKLFSISIVPKEGYEIDEEAIKQELTQITAEVEEKNGDGKPIAILIPRFESEISMLLPRDQKDERNQRLAKRIQETIDAIPKGYMVVWTLDDALQAEANKKEVVETVAAQNKKARDHSSDKVINQALKTASSEEKESLLGSHDAKPSDIVELPVLNIAPPVPYSKIPSWKPFSQRREEPSQESRFELIANTVTNCCSIL